MAPKFKGSFAEVVRDLTAIEESTGCWLWKNLRRGVYGPHRRAYEHFKGPVPPDKIVRHTCDDTRCVNPEHLVTGTKKDNRQDFMKRHPRAATLVNKAVRKAQKECKRFWLDMTEEERKEFCKRRAETQNKKGNRTHSPETRAKIKAAWVKRKERIETKFVTARAGRAANQGFRKYYNNLTEEEYAAFCKRRSDNMKAVWARRKG